MSFFTKKSALRTAFLFLVAACFFSSCNSIDLFEKDTVIPNYKWESNFSASGTFNVADTASLYNVYLVLRHTDAYDYNNIWLNAGLQPPGDSMQFQRINLLLGDDRNGWEGAGANDIWEVRKMISNGPRRFKKGEYRYNISQLMRESPLPQVMSVGIRLEKAP